MNMYCLPKWSSEVDVFLANPLRTGVENLCSCTDGFLFIEHGEKNFMSAGLDLFISTGSNNFQFLESVEGFIDKIEYYDNKIWIENSARGDYWICPLFFYDLEHHKLVQVTQRDGCFSVHQQTLFVWVFTFHSDEKTSKDWIGIYQQNNEIRKIWEYPDHIHVTSVFCIDDSHYGVLCNKKEIHIVDSHQNYIKSIS